MFYDFICDMGIVHRRLIERASLLCTERSDLWLLTVPIHCFVMVQVHCLDRVMHQFGLHQHSPNDVDTLI